MKRPSDKLPAKRDESGQAVDPRDIDRAYVRGTLKSRPMTKALDTIAKELEKDPEALARVMRRWLHDG